MTKKSQISETYTARVSTIFERTCYFDVRGGINDIEIAKQLAREMYVKLKGKRQVEILFGGKLVFLFKD